MFQGNGNDVYTIAVGVTHDEASVQFFEDQGGGKRRVMNVARKNFRVLRGG